MAIRFLCSACSQPIEIDDEWASKLVACPYCRKTVTAPFQSQLEDLGQIPVASAVTDHVDTPGTPRNLIAKVAMVLACGLLILLISIRFVLAAHQQEVEELMTAMAKAEGFAEMSQVSLEFFQAGIPGWYVALAVLELSSGLVWLGALVCGIIGVRRLPHRRRAIFALVIVGLVPVFTCCGGLTGG